MANFKEFLEVTKNSTCFLTYTFVKVKEDLATGETIGANVNLNASLGKVSDLIEKFCTNEEQTFAAIQQLMNTGSVQLIDEY